jgi:hypothetical protein
MQSLDVTNGREIIKAADLITTHENLDKIY